MVVSFTGNKRRDKSYW